MENEKKWIVIGTTDIWLRNENGGTIDSIIAGKEFTLCNYDEKIGMFYAIFGDKEGYVKGTGLQLQQNGQWKDITKAELIEIMK